MEVSMPKVYIRLGVDVTKLSLFKVLDEICNTNGNNNESLYKILSKSRYSDSLDYLRTHFKKKIDNTTTCNTDDQPKKIIKRKLFRITSRSEENKDRFVECFTPLVTQQFKKDSKNQEVMLWNSEKLVAANFINPSKIARLEISTDSVAVYVGSTFYQSQGELTFDRNHLLFQISFREWTQMEMSSTYLKHITVYAKCPFIKICARTKIVEEISAICKKYEPQECDLLRITPKKSKESKDVIYIFTRKSLSKSESDQLITLFGNDRVKYNDSYVDCKEILDNVFHKHLLVTEFSSSISKHNWAAIFDRRFTEEASKDTRIPSPIGNRITVLCRDSGVNNESSSGPTTSTPTKFDPTPNIFNQLRHDNNQATVNNCLSSSSDSPNISSLNQFMNNTARPSQSLISLSSALNIDNSDNNNSSNSSIKQLQSSNLYYIPSRNLGNIFETFHYNPSPECDILIHGTDLLCLNAGQYLNDNIINFYLNVIRYEIMSEDQRRRTHLFNIFFNTKLRGTTAITDTSETRHSRVSKWTKKVDIFDKDYLIIPFNEKLHWFVAIVCFPWMAGMVSYDRLLGINPTQTMSEIPLNKSSFATIGRQNRVKYLREHYGVDPKPCILLFDSLQFETRAPSVHLIREYLKTEWDCKRLATDGPLVFDKNTIRGFNPQVPQQTNSTDCGIFVLHYVEQFFTKPPAVYTKDFFQSSLLSWFKNETVGRKRAAIQKMVLKKADKVSASATNMNSSSDISFTTVSNMDDSGPDIQIL